MIDAFEIRYRAIHSRDARFDGRFWSAVTTTGVYCRPSCPAVTPRRENVRFYPTVAAAQRAGFRACKRCRPEAVPGSPEWDGRSSLAGRALRLIADGVVDREGVAGLAERLGYTGRHLHRLLAAELGAGPSALARAQRAATARTLLETTDLPVTQVAFAAGFSSIRQFNETLQTIFARTPTALRQTRRREESPPGSISLRLPYREPMDVASTLSFLGARAVPGVEAFAGGIYRRTLRLPHGAGIVELSVGGPSRRSSPAIPGQAFVRCVLRLDDLRDLGAAVGRCRRLLDLDADPIAVAEHLGVDPILAPLVRHSPGLRIAGTVDGGELAVRAILASRHARGGARCAAGHIVSVVGELLPRPVGTLTHLFPEPAALLAAAPATLALAPADAQILLCLCQALDTGHLRLEPSADRGSALAALRSIPGIDPWTVARIAMRALDDPDAFSPADPSLRCALVRLGASGDPADVAALADRWRPWRGYAAVYLWSTLARPDNLHKGASS